MYLVLCIELKRGKKDEIKKWLHVGNPQSFYPSGASKIFESLIFMLTIFSLAGIVWAVIEKDADFCMNSIIFLCLAIGHSITYMDLMYYYLKIPFLFLFTGYFIQKLKALKREIVFGSHKLNLANLVLTAIFISIILLDLKVLI